MPLSFTPFTPFPPFPPFIFPCPHQWADKYKRMSVLANAATSADVTMALELGAEGLGLFRTEEMFFRWVNGWIDSNRLSAQSHLV